MECLNLVNGYPILILSYKNHAIDEFLLDLAKSSKLSMIRFGKCMSKKRSYII
jgi:hypothetical protein